VKKRVINFLRWFFRLFWRATLWFFVLSIVSVIIFRWVPIPVTPLMLMRCVEQKWDGKPLKLHKEWVSLDKITNEMQLAVVCSEDQNFLIHHGFDLDAIDRAMDYNTTHKRTRGASTISQQTAKNVFLWQGQGLTRYLRKGLEVYFTFLIETFWSKERIMEVYLNVIEVGDGVYGVQAGAHDFFKRNAGSLNKQQAALIAAVLPNPRRFSAKNPGPYIYSRQEFVMNQMRLWGGVLNYHVKEK
jgi:monofunctional biosynthetic peptidoglycan transglycosylase